MGVVSPVLGFCEPISSWLHVGGAIVAGLSSRALRRTASTPGTDLALRVFAGAVVLSLAVSGAYHAFALDSAPRAVFQRLDHAFIWILIAATFTPVHVILFQGPWRWGILTVIWVSAAAGVVLKTVFFADVGNELGLSLYLVLGWMGAISAGKIWLQEGRRATHLLLAGGLLYSVGGVASIVGSPALVPGYVGHHELFHVAVLAGLYFHWRFMQSAVALRAASLSPRAEMPATMPA